MEMMDSADDTGRLTLMEIPVGECSLSARQVPPADLVPSRDLLSEVMPQCLGSASATSLCWHM